MNKKTYVIGIILFVIAFAFHLKSVEKRKAKQNLLPGKTTQYKKEWDVDTLLIKNVNLIKVAEKEILKGVDVFIENGIIKGIGDFDKVEAGMIIDAKGKYLMPSMIDTHIHVHFKETFAMLLLHGVTTARDMSERKYDPKLISFKEPIKNKEILSADLLYSSRIIDGYPKEYPELHEVTTEKEGIKLVKEYAEKGYDYIKIYHHLTEDVLKAIFDEAKKQNIKVIGHKSNYVELDKLIKLGQNSFEHLQDFLTFEQIDRVPYFTKLLKEHNAYLTPTLSVLKCAAFEKITKEKYYKYMPDRMLQLYKKFDYFLDYHNEKTYTQVKMNEMIKSLYENNTPVLIGTDTGMPFVVPGYNLIEELKLMADGGYDNKTLIKMATYGNAQGLDLTDRGLIKEGYKAHLLLLSENPYDNIDSLHNIDYIIKDSLVLNKNQVTEIWKSIEYNR